MSKKQTKTKTGQEYYDKNTLFKRLERLIDMNKNIDSVGDYDWFILALYDIAKEYYDVSGMDIEEIYKNGM